MHLCTISVDFLSVWYSTVNPWTPAKVIELVNVAAKDALSANSSPVTPQPTMMQFFMMQQQMLLMQQSYQAQAQGMTRMGGMGGMMSGMMGSMGGMMPLGGMGMCMSGPLQGQGNGQVQQGVGDLGGMGGMGGMGMGGRG